jgi:AcrR family transcriptional regulator
MTMGIRERRDREHEATRQAILDAARDLFVAEGYENVSIRKIAERVEYSPAAIYGYFTGKEEIFFALAETGFRLFAGSVRRIRPTPDPLEMLRRRFWQYYQFSKAQPEYFALMFVDRAVPRISREWEQFEFTRRGRDETAEVLERCIESGIFPRATNPDAVFHILAAAIHGAAVIRLSDRFIPQSAADALAHDVLEAAIAGLRHGSATTIDAQVGFHATRSGQSDGDPAPATSEAAASATAREPATRRRSHGGRTGRMARGRRATKQTRPTL